MRDLDFSKLNGNNYSKFRNLFDMDMDMPDEQLKNVLYHVQNTINDPRVESTKFPYTDEATYVFVRKDEYIQDFLSKNKVTIPTEVKVGEIKKIKEIYSQIKKPALLPHDLLDAFGNLCQLHNPQEGK